MEQAPVIDRDKISKIVGTKIKNVALYQRAFTHKSALKRYSGLTGSYETLEFMGDSVLGFIITRHLFDTYEKEQEGFMTKIRTKMVRGSTLCKISKELGLHEFILMDQKGEANNWIMNDHIMEDVFEAFVGAIYLDIGMVHAKNFVLNVFSQVETSLDDDNYKDQLMRWCQALKMPLPEYPIVSHRNGTFCVQVVLDGVECGCGFATTKKQAEQNAAELILKTDHRFKNKTIPTNASKSGGTSGGSVPRATESGVAGPQGGDAHGQ